MFDYQAGEKYKLTLIMVGAAGAMGGMFFTMILMPPSEPQHVQARRPKWADHPDVNGGRTAGAHTRAINGYQADPEEQAAQAQADAQQQPYVHTDQEQAVTLIEQWLPAAWDFSAQSAGTNQEKAIQYMTADCASAYRTNIWTPDMAATIAQSGARSEFRKSAIKVGETRPDGAVVVVVEGQQVLEVPGKGQNVHDVKLEYLVKQTTDGQLKVAGICEAGKSLGL